MPPSVARFRRFHQAVRFALPKRNAILIILALTILMAGANAAEPLALKFIFDELAAQHRLQPGAILVVRGEITVGTVVAFLGYVGGLFGPIQGLSGIYSTLSKASVSLDEICRILDVQEYLGDSPDAHEIQHARGEVEFDNVHFRRVWGVGRGAWARVERLY